MLPIPSKSFASAEESLVPTSVATPIKPSLFSASAKEFNPREEVNASAAADVHNLTLGKLCFDKSNFHQVRNLGKGSSSSVVLWKSHTGQEVAVKKFNVSRDDRKY